MARTFDITVGPSDLGELFGWQLTTTNIGLAGAGVDKNTLPVYSGSDEPTAGTTISLKKIETGLNLRAGNITIDRCWIRPTNMGAGFPLMLTHDQNDPPNTVTPTRVTIKDSEVDGSAAAVSLAAYCAANWGIMDWHRCYVHDLGAGPTLYNTGTSLSNIIENVYVRDLLSFGDPATTGNHADGFTARDFANAGGRTSLIRNNRFDCSTANATGAFFLQAQGSNISNITVQGNLFEGGGYECVMEANVTGTYSNMRLINNRFNPPTGYGYGYTDNASWDEQTDNYANDPGAADHRGAPIVL